MCEVSPVLHSGNRGVFNRYRVRGGASAIIVGTSGGHALAFTVMCVG